MSARRDGEKTGASESLDRHLASCAECARFERELDQLDPLFAALRDLDPAPELERRIETLAETRASAGPSIRSHWLLHAAAAIVGFLSVVAFARSSSATRIDDDGRSLELFARAGRSFSNHEHIDSLPEREFLAHYRTER